ncbi:hypothetical protein ACSBR2_005258 [Camellia fascicularis]
MAGFQRTLRLMNHKMSCFSTPKRHVEFFTQTKLGELEQAHRSVFQALLSIPDSPEAIVTAIYVDLMIGKTQEALAKLKQCSRVRVQGIGGG